jgi:hypothetical protein
LPETSWCSRAPSVAFAATDADFARYAADVDRAGCSVTVGPASNRTPPTFPERRAGRVRFGRTGPRSPGHGPRGDVGGAEQRSPGVGARSALRSSFSRRLSERSARSARSEFRRATPGGAAEQLCSEVKRFELQRHGGSYPR